MNLATKKTRVIIIGKNGGFARAISDQVCEIYPESEQISFSTREMGKSLLDLQLDYISSTQRVFNDILIWCAGVSSNRSTASECKKDEKTLKDFMIRFLRQVKTSPIVCYLSSGGTVYGNSPGVVNELSPLNPQTAYAEMKIRSEEFLQGMSKDGQISLIIFRLANAYGSKGTSYRTNLVDSALLNDSITITVNPNSRKQYGTYKDYARFLLTYLKDFGQTPGNSLIQNVYSQYAYTIEEVLLQTLPYNLCRKESYLYELGQSTGLETVLLDTINSQSNFQFQWQSLRDYLDRSY